MSAYKSLIIITGGQMGLGYEATREIAKQRPDALIVICSRSSGEEAAKAINTEVGRSTVEWQRLDLGDLSDVRRFASVMLARDLPISALVLNAGLQVINFGYTADGVEKTFGINHVGHALLFYLLAPRFTNKARVVITASGVHDPAQKTGMPDAKYTSAEALAHPDEESKKGDGRQKYCTSKLCNILWTYALERRRKEKDLTFTVNALDPGLMPGTGLARDNPPLLQFIWKKILPRIIPLLRILMFPNIHTSQESGLALARLAVSPDVDGVSGKYFEGLKQIDSSKDSNDVSSQDDLWEWTASFVGKDEAEVEAYKQLNIGTKV